MRRTTICRSSRAVLLAALVAFVAASAAQGQDTTAAAAQDTTPAVAAPALGELPATHTVVQGETLWSLGQLYYGDPLLWPEIYRINTAIIEDPHWIYPGEVLMLAPSVAVAAAPEDTVVAVGPAPADTVAAVAQVTGADTVRAQAGAADTVAAVAPPPADTLVADTTQAVAAPVVLEEPPPPPPPTETYQTVFERRHTRAQDIQDVLRAYADQRYRPLRRGEFYAAGFLSEKEKLPWATVLGSTATPAIHRLSERTSAQRFDEIAIRPPENASYHVGDSLLVARIDRELDTWGQVVVPLGVVRVTAVQEKQVLAEVVMQFARIRNGQLALPLEPFKDPGETRPTPVEQGLEGRLIAARDPHTITSAQQILFIDRGRAEGIVPGDVFEVYRPATERPGSASEETRAILLVVHTREHSAAGLVIGLRNPDLTPGLPVRLIKKMPS